MSVARSLARVIRTAARFRGRHHSRSVIKYARDFGRFREALGHSHEWPFGEPRPIINEWYQAGGHAIGAYFHQDLWAARKIFERNPSRHIDVGSRVDGFVAHVACFREIEVYDIRPMSGSARNIKFVQRDLMKSAEREVCDSLSSLHVIEHFGLGRYGDEINPWGYKTGFKCISALLRPGGSFYFSVPLGPQRIEFNAHRVFGLRHLLSLIDENGFARDLVDLPDSVKNGLEIIPVSRMDEVLSRALTRKLEPIEWDEAASNLTAH